MHQAVYDPDGKLIALFVSDAHAIEPTQHKSTEEYYTNWCSDFCLRREYPATMPINDIPQQV